MILTVSLAQMQIQFGHPEENFAIAQKLIIEAASHGSSLILLPELWSTGYLLQNAANLANTNRLLLPRIARLARELSIFIGGSMLLAKDGRVYNTFAFQSPGDLQPIFYEKVHLFRLMEEDR